LKVLVLEEPYLVGVNLSARECSFERAARLEHRQIVPVVLNVWWVRGVRGVGRPSPKVVRVHRQHLSQTCSAGRHVRQENEQASQVNRATGQSTSELYGTEAAGRGLARLRWYG